MIWYLAILNRLLSILLICLTAIVGDNLVYTSNSRINKALYDNITHGAIGALTWATASYFAGSPRGQIPDIALCTALAMLIDVDHFAAAQSLRIEDASSLSHRPPLHCTTVPMAICALGLLVVLITKSAVVFRLTCIVGAAFFSHHFRDAARRGLWLWPFGSTPPFHPLLYFSSLSILPHVLAAIITHVDATQKLRNVYTTMHLV